nr:hypothetical protein [Tanacetum cinerariifolium]
SPPPVKESTVTIVSTSLELLSNIVPPSSATALGPNEERVNAMVDGPDNKMGASHVVDDATELTVTRLEHVSFGPGDVVVALSAREKGDGSTPSSTLKRGGARGMPNNTCFSELGAN